MYHKLNFSSSSAPGAYGGGAHGGAGDAIAHKGGGTRPMCHGAHKRTFGNVTTSRVMTIMTPPSPPLSTSSGTLPRLVRVASVEVCKHERGKKNAS